MSITTTDTITGVTTSERMKSSSQQMESMEEMVGKVEQLASRKKNMSKEFHSNSDRTIRDKEQTPESKVGLSSPVGPVLSEDPELVASQVWNEMFEDNPFDQVAMGSDYI